MKQDFRSYALVKAVALLLTVACAAGAVFGWFYSLSHWDSMFSDGDFTYTPAWNQAMNDQYSTLMNVLDRYDQIRRGVKPGYLAQKRYDESLAALDPSVTNFRYIVRDNATGDILLSSSGADSLNNVLESSIYSSLWTTTPDTIYYNWREYDQGQNLTLFYNDYGEVFFQVEGNVSELYEDGDTYQYAIEYGVDALCNVQDAFWDAGHTYYTQGDVRVLYWAVALTAATLIGTVLLMCCAGRRRGCDTFVLNWTDRIPYDLYLFALCCAVVGCFALGGNALWEGYAYHWDQPSTLYAMLGIAGAAFTAGFALTEAGLMSIATRIKTHTLLKNTVVWRLLKWLGRGFRALVGWWGTTFGNWNMTQRIIVGFLLYLIGTVLTGLTVVLIPFYQGAVLFGLCKWSEQWRNIRAGTQAIVGGSPETVIDTSGMDRYLCRDLKEHAGQLNDLGSAINTAVDERLKSERMKAELITNVSHDLKTPLTSIISYAELLKQEGLEPPAGEYVDILAQKAERLRSMVLDVFEVSKAASGELPVKLESLDLAKLLRQTMADMAQAIEAAPVILRQTLPEEPVTIVADGDRLYRVFQNLLQNALKYALEGSRVYLTLTRTEGKAVVSVKNTSKTELPEGVDFTARFVRGDESRTDGGSGLGLAIAESFTAACGGKLRVEPVADLFVVTVEFPLAGDHGDLPAVMDAEIME